MLADGVAAARLLALKGTRQWGRCGFVGEGGKVEFDVEAWMTQFGLTVRTHKTEAGADLWELASCPFNPEHDKGEAFITRSASGALLAGCHHDLSPQDVDVRGLLPALSLSMTDVTTAKPVTAADFSAGAAAVRAFRKISARHAAGAIRKGCADNCFSNSLFMT